MNCTQCVVRPSANDGWVTEVKTKEFGPYQSRDMALRVAIAAALERRRAGEPANVVVKDGDGATRAERCLCSAFGR